MNSASSTLTALLIAVVVVAAVYLMREVLIPLALAGILSFMLAPPVRVLQRLRLPREPDAAPRYRSLPPGREASRHNQQTRFQTLSPVGPR